MSLLDALSVGGFLFPDGTEGADKSDQNIYHSENVLICERNNQLSQRLCLIRKGVIIQFLSFYDSAKIGLDRPAGNERNIYIRNVPNLVNAPF